MEKRNDNIINKVIEITINKPITRTIQDVTTQESLVTALIKTQQI